MAANTVTVRDPVHGDIELTREELSLIDTAEFQRLRGIKQLGTAYLVFPGALHTRFEHSIGTLHMTDRLLSAVDRNSTRRVDADERRVLRIAALLHDITHIPFGHNIEDQTGLLERHDRPDRYRKVLGDTALGSALERAGIRRQVLAIFGADDTRVPPFWRQVLSDTIDADLLDYLRRDAYFTGLELRYDARVHDYFRIDAESERLYVDCEKNGMLREDIASELMRVLEMRYHFSERVYYHHAKIAAGASLARMVELAMRHGGLDAEHLQSMTDASLLAHLASCELGDGDADRMLASSVARFRSRQLPKRVLVLPVYLNADLQDELVATWFAPGRADARSAWERELEQRAREELGRELEVMMYSPARRMQLKEARTLVRMPASVAAHGELRELCEFTEAVPRLRDLQSSYPRLWKLYVLTSEPDRDVRRALQRIALSMLPSGCENALRL